MYFGQTRPMEVYDRQIRYLDYMENGLRTRGAGFVKLERQDNLCSISLQVSGLYRKDRFTRPLLMLDEQGERELCRLQLADGGIKLYLDRLDCNNLDGQGLRYEQLTGFRIPISEGKEVRCILGVREMAKPVIAQEEKAAVREPVWEVVSKPEPQPLCSVGSEFTPLQNMVPKIEIHKLEAEKIEAHGMKTPESEATRIEAARIEATRIETPNAAAVKDDKWEQLWAIYPHKFPFLDDREYLALGPGDFVILSERNYKLVNNSFLLHGYYNYKHLILTRIREHNQMRFYIGVPGIFMEREKRTAVMFGFKSFECAVEPAQEGDFGYYMIPVEL